MSLPSERILLRIYLQSADRAPHVPTYARIVAAARQANLAGATVLRGFMGAGYHGIIQGSRWALIEHVPVIVEIVDSQDRIAAFIKESLDPIMVGGMLTLERAAVIMHRPRAAQSTNRLNLAAALEPLSTVPKIEPGIHMTKDDNGILLRVFIGESDRLEGRPLYQAIVQKVRDLGLAGATVLRGIEGFGANSIVHKASLLEMSADLPIVIEIVDTDPKIKTLLPYLEQTVREGMITMEYVVIVAYRHDPAPSS